MTLSEIIDKVHDRVSAWWTTNNAWADLWFWCFLGIAAIIAGVVWMRLETKAARREGRRPLHCIFRSRHHSPSADVTPMWAQPKPKRASAR